MALDLDRPYIARKHPSGVRIYSFTDEPAGFYDEAGKPIGRDLAREAGFPVDRMIVQAEKNHRLTEYQRQLEAEFDERSKELDRASALSEVGDGIEVRPMQAGKYKVLRDGEPLTKKALTIDEAEKLVEGMRDGQEEPKDDPAPAAEGRGAGATPRGGEGKAPAASAGAGDLI